MCQINTIPMKSQIGYLDVTGRSQQKARMFLIKIKKKKQKTDQCSTAILVPPDFINFETSQDVMIRENQNLTLRCKARGHPEPK